MVMRSSNNNNNNNNSANNNNNNNIVANNQPNEPNMERSYRLSIILGIIVLTLLQLICLSITSTKVILCDAPSSICDEQQSFTVFVATSSSKSSSSKRLSSSFKKKSTRDDVPPSTTKTTSSLPLAGAGAGARADDDDDDDNDKWWKVTTSSADTLADDIDDVENLKHLVKCGWWKCYYPSKSQSNKFGYVIGQDRRSPKSATSLTKSTDFNMENLDRSYNLAIQLQKQYGNINHCMVSPPIAINCTSNLASILNIGFISSNPIIPFKNTTRPKRKGFPTIPDYRLFRKTNITLEEQGPQRQQQRDNRLIIQVVKQVPQPNLLINLKGIRFMKQPLSIYKFAGAQHFFESLKFNIPGSELFLNNNASSSFSSSSNSNIIDDDDENNNNNLLLLSSFQNNLRKDWNSTKFAWKSNPELLLDYQFLLDTQGHIWQLDMDRAYGSYEEERNEIFSDNATNIIIQKLNEIEELFINPLLLQR